MTRLPKALTANLQIEKGVRAENLRHDGKKWIITTDTAGDFTSDSIVITAPLPQTLELLTKSHLSYNPDLNSIHYSKAVMALVITKDGVAPDGVIPEGIHSLLPMSERHLHPRGFVIRASEEISNQMFDTNSDEEILSFLVNQFKKAFLKAPEIEYSELKKWRYVLPMKALPDPYLEVHKNLFITGDSFVYNDVRGALNGAHALAEKLNSLS
jgi:predicted NAD/FAD-dependent oxidoreductase